MTVLWCAACLEFALGWNTRLGLGNEAGAAAGAWELIAGIDCAGRVDYSRVAADFPQMNVPKRNS